MRRVLTVGILTIFTLSLLWLAAAVIWQRQDGRTSKGNNHQSPQREAATISVGQTPVVVEVARTAEAWQRGLMDRDSLAPDAGMLFVFPRAEPRTMWMKDTHIPLDLIWIRAGHVVGITERVQPEPGVPDEELHRYPSPGPVDFVLEVNSGWAVEHGIHEGDAVRHAREAGNSREGGGRM